MEALATRERSEPNDVEPGSVARPAQPPFALTLGLFVFSGATGLIDQLCFSKYLSYIVGSTAYAVSAVLAAFMTGLAIGAHFGGKASTRIRRPLLAYGWLELVVAAAVALTPLGFRFLTPLYASVARAVPDSLTALSMLRWLVALALVVVPTMAMGATLPFLSRSLEAADGDTESERLRERRLGWLYAMNTLGGACGALAAAYAILPLLGIDGTVLASAALSALVGVGALVLGRRSPAAEPVVVDEATAPATVSGSIVVPRDVPLLHLLAFVSGCLVFSSEVVFTHLLALIIGNSAYAFGLILAVFLSCLFIGAAQAPRTRARFGDRALPVSLTLTGLALVATLTVWDKLPVLFNNTGEVIQSFAARELIRGLAAFLALCIPTTCMGLTFPLLLSRVASYPEVGRWVGRLTAVNTLGAVLGSLATGYVLLPWLGSQRALIAFSFVFVVAALASRRWASGAARRPMYACSALAVVFAVLAPRWDIGRLTSGTNVYFEGHQGDEDVLSIREDVHGGVTTVTRKSDGVVTLYTNGKFQGNTGWEMNAQRFFAHYPAIFVKKFDELLLIGLGTGTTLGTLTGYPFRHIDMVEISPSILEAAQTYFTVVNRGALSDPRVELHHADGRNFVLVEQRKYDLIGMELSSIWFSGAASLYSKEYYELIRARLEPGGVFQQWVQLHHVRPKDFATVLHTLREVFPHVILFYGGGQGILVSSMEPLELSEARIDELESKPELRATIPFNRPLMSLLNDVLLLGPGLDRFLEESAQKAGEPVEALVSTDGNLYLEYATPRGNVLPWAARDALVADMKRHRDLAAIEALVVP